MSGVGLIGEAVLIHRNDAVQDPDLLRAGASFSETSTNFDLERLLELGLIPVEIIVKSQSGEIVTVDDDGNVSVGMVKDARIAASGDKTETL